MDWSLEQLSTHVEAALAAADVGPLNGQIAEVPNARTIRYYTTIGLLDRPRSAGRTALYGRRHLEQLVAIKRLQARGLPLADVQRELSALDDAGLAALAALPSVPAETAGPVQHTETRRDRAFWNAEPSAPVPSPAPAPVPASGVTPVAEAPASASAVTPAQAITGITLADGVTLAFVCARPVDDQDLEALRAALDGVTELLRKRGLL